MSTTYVSLRIGSLEKRLELEMKKIWGKSLSVKETVE